MPVLKEWIKPHERELTDDELKRVPDGKRVKLISADKYGEMQWIEGFVVSRGREKAMQYYADGGVREMAIRPQRGKIWVVERREFG